MSEEDRSDDEEGPLVGLANSEDVTEEEVDKMVQDALSRARRVMGETASEIADSSLDKALGMSAEDNDDDDSDVDDNDGDNIHVDNGKLARIKAAAEERTRLTNLELEAIREARSRDEGGLPTTKTGTATATKSQSQAQSQQPPSYFTFDSHSYGASSNDAESVSETNSYMRHILGGATSMGAYDYDDADSDNDDGTEFSDTEFLSVERMMADMASGKISNFDDLIEAERTHAEQHGVVTTMDDGNGEEGSFGSYEGMILDNGGRTAVQSSTVAADAPNEESTEQVKDMKSSKTELTSLLLKGDVEKEDSNDEGVVDDLPSRQKEPAEDDETTVTDVESKSNKVSDVEDSFVTAEASPTKPEKLEQDVDEDIGVTEICTDAQADTEETKSYDKAVVEDPFDHSIGAKTIKVDKHEDVKDSSAIATEEDEQEDVEDSVVVATEKDEQEDVEDSKAVVEEEDKEEVVKRNLKDTDKGLQVGATEAKIGKNEVAEIKDDDNDNGPTAAGSPRKEATLKLEESGPDEITQLNKGDKGEEDDDGENEEARERKQLFALEKAEKEATAALLEVQQLKEKQMKDEEERNHQRQLALEKDEQVVVGEDNPWEVDDENEEEEVEDVVVVKEDETTEMINDMDSIVYAEPVVLYTEKGSSQTPSSQETGKGGKRTKDPADVSVSGSPEDREDKYSSSVNNVVEEQGDDDDDDDLTEDIDLDNVAVGSGFAGAENEDETEASEDDYTVETVTDNEESGDSAVEQGHEFIQAAAAPPGEVVYISPSKSRRDSSSKTSNDPAGLAAPKSLSFSKSKEPLHSPWNTQEKQVDDVEDEDAEGGGDGNDEAAKVDDDRSGRKEELASTSVEESEDVPNNDGNGENGAMQEGDEGSCPSFSPRIPVKFRFPYPIPPMPPEPRPAEAILETHGGSEVYPPYRTRWKDPSPALAELISAAGCRSVQRRSNACGAIKVLAAKDSNRRTLARTRGLLEVLASAATIRPTDTAGIDARVRATMALLHLSAPVENRRLLYGFPGCTTALVHVVRKDVEEARVHACRALAYLAKTHENKRGMVTDIPGLVDTLAAVVADDALASDDVRHDDERSLISDEDGDARYDVRIGSNSGSSCNLEAVPGSGTVRPNTQSNANGNDSAVTGGGGGGTTSTTTGNGIGGRKRAPFKNKKPILSEHQRLEMRQRYLMAARTAACATLLHLLKFCPNAAELSKNDSLLHTLTTVAVDFDSPPDLHTRCVEMLCHLSRFGPNASDLSRNADVIETLVRCGTSQYVDDRIWSLRTLQNLATDRPSKARLATPEILGLLSARATSDNEEERRAATYALLNVATEPAAIVPLTNTRNVVATLVHLAHDERSSAETVEVACEALGTVGLWLQTLAASGTVPDQRHTNTSNRNHRVGGMGDSEEKEDYPAVLPTHRCSGWQRWKNNTNGNANNNNNNKSSSPRSQIQGYDGGDGTQTSAERSPNATTYNQSHASSHPKMEVMAGPSSS